MSSTQSVMSHYPNPRKLRSESLTKGLSYADEAIQSVMVESARLRMQELIESLEAKGLHDVTTYGQVWLADHIAYLADRIVATPSTEVCKAYLDFPTKFRCPDGVVISTDEYLSNVSKYRSQGIKYIHDSDDHEQIRINKFVSEVGLARNRSRTVAYVCLTALLEAVYCPDEHGVTCVSGNVMRSVLTQLIALKRTELKPLIPVPTVTRICNLTDTKLLTKVLGVLGIQSPASLSTMGLLVEGRVLIELCCSVVGIKITPDGFVLDESVRSKLDDIRTKCIASSCDYRPVLERPVSDGRYNSYRQAPLKDLVVSGAVWDGSGGSGAGSGDDEYNFGGVVLSKFDTEAIDRIQGTQFSVNRAVLGVLERAVALGADGRYHIPDKLNLPVPELPTVGSVSWSDMDTMRKARSSAISVNDANKRTLDIARWYADWGGAFYLPVFMDYRTRVYYLSTTFNPQASKLAKSLFCANKGKAIGTEQALEYWLVNFIGAKAKVVCPDTGAVYSGDKCSWDLAVKLGKLELSVGAMVASDPLGKGWGVWSVQDNPFEYLAHCFECEGLLRDGLSHVSYLFVSMDGSCNAYQHASGYLGDRATGSLVNLTYRDRSAVPADLYGAVAEYVGAHLDCSVESHAWLKVQGVVTRKSVKRIVMCQGYGLTNTGAKRYAEAELLPYPKYDGLLPDGYFSLAEVLADLIMTAVGRIAPSIIKVKDALKSLGLLVGGTIEWTTHTGTKVKYTKLIEETKRADRIIHGRRVVFNYKVKSDKVDRVSLANALAPNFTHSRDADHLRLSVMGMPVDTALLLVHDSFGCLASDAPEFNKVIKSMFVRMYQHTDALGQFVESVLDPYLSGLGLSLELIKSMNPVQIKSHQHKSTIKSVLKILSNIVQTNDLDYDELLTSRYAFR